MLRNFKKKIASVLCPLTSVSLSYLPNNRINIEGLLSHNKVVSHAEDDHLKCDLNLHVST